MLVNADPQGSIPKPSKKARQEKANLLPTVQAALGRFFALAAILDPPLLLIPVVPLICEETNMSYV
jgi:hypothetical protein